MKLSQKEVLNALKVQSIDDIKKISNEFSFKDGFYIPESMEYKILSKNLSVIFSKLPLSSAAKAYRKKHSYYDFFRPHLEGEHFLRLDIKAFFNSITSEHLEGFLISHLKGKNAYEIKMLARAISFFLTVKVDKKQILPIGFPASPSIANLIFRPLDITIEKLCHNKKIIYSRYSDDLLFSSASGSVIHSSWFESQISYIISKLDMRLNTSKRIATSKEISLNGYVLYGEENNKKIRFSNQRLRILKKLIHYKKVRNLPDRVIAKKLFQDEVRILDSSLRFNKKSEFLDTFCRDQVINKLRGYRSYLISLLKYDNLYSCVDREYKIYICDLIGELNSIIFSYDRG
ncbi:RNA-directed DNA polymerase [Pseudoalteromonas rubra]|uniref:RNA-directed DNA polymerase n=1 Tax=Pseudoalteromonas rubra TaxID=43658 RepID=A0A5S3WMD4_9GAMM|nr:reverse transcriptase family protein [Pseudoalteromonas rubra]TMP28585.1 RNA-directed DNA polymerase [Pseudoalteromonas rubra]TMP28856.1 RNA-directed DNA polymerase [Pseudoalteromonas rubra]